MTIKYMVYTTDALKIICNNMASYFGGGVMSQRFAEWVLPEQEETRPATAIIAHMKKLLGSLEVSG